MKKVARPKGDDLPWCSLRETLPIHRIKARGLYLPEKTTATDAGDGDRLRGEGRQGEIGFVGGRKRKQPRRWKKLDSLEIHVQRHYLGYSCPLLLNSEMCFT